MLCHEHKVLYQMTILLHIIQVEIHTPGRQQVGKSHFHNGAHLMLTPELHLCSGCNFCTHARNWSYIEGFVVQDH